MVQGLFQLGIGSDFSVIEQYVVLLWSASYTESVMPGEAGQEYIAVDFCMHCRPTCKTLVMKIAHLFNEVGFILLIMSRSMFT